MNRILILAAVVALSGCQTMYKPSDMSPEQLKAMASDNKGVGYCMSAQNATGNITGTFANLDLVNKITGSVVIEPGCKMTITGGAITGTALIPGIPAASAPK